MRILQVCGRLFLVLWLALAPVKALAGSMTLLGAGKAGTLPGPPVLAYNTTSNASGTTAQTVAVTLPSSGGPFWVGILVSSRPTSTVVSSITLTNTNGTSSCSTDAQGGDGSTTPWTFVAHCLTSAANPGASTVTVNYPANPFVTAAVAVWNAPSSGFSSLLPVGTITAGLASASTISSTSSATNAGFCIVLGTTSVILTGPAVDSSASTFTYTQRTISGAGGQSYWSADTTASSTTTQTTSAAWSGTGLPTRLGLAAGCWR